MILFGQRGIIEQGRSPGREFRKKMKLAYVRVSSTDQNEASQIEALKGHGIEKWFTEKISGKNMDRPKLQELMDFAREGDTVYVLDFSRLARSTSDLLKIVEFFDTRKIVLVSLKEQIDTSTPTGKLMLTMIGAINEFERQNLLERQREGIAVAKAVGKYAGRKRIEVPDIQTHYQRYRSRKISKAQLAKELHISRSTLDRLFAELESPAK